MLEGIEDIDWGSLKHAYGSAKHTPTHIVKLASDIPADWLEAIDALWATINHQGSIYSATSYVVPFLIELAGAPRTGSRADP
ncbi:hypothetical protein [Singulisphaera sp. PoT]|uniref:hypothetical protein n=1 Tax=Singulisphaera sp. PoT TaxID=3411797 RepID=UPI003BF53B3D